MEKIVWDFDNFSDLNEVSINVKTENLSTKEIQILMPQDSVMKEHKAPFNIIVQVLKGEIEFSVNNKIITLNSLDSISLESNVPHSLKALKNSIIRLSINKKDSVVRINAVLKG